MTDSTTKRTRSRKPVPAKRNRKSTTKPDTAEVSAVAQAMRELTIEYRGIDEVHDYEFNPRNNAEAIEVVRQSIRQFGFINPIIVDQDDIIVVGHTRRAAGRLEGYTRVPTIKAEHLTEKQIAAFRIVDNKVGEVATWNYELLAKEIADMEGVDMTLFGFSQEQVDCLEGMVEDDCLFALAQEGGETDVTNSAENAPENAKNVAPATTRFVLGEFVIHMPATTYQAWAREIREDCEFSQDKINEEILRRLGVEHDGTEIS